MRKMLVVAAREYKAAVKSKAFVIGLLALPVMMGGGLAVQLLLEDKVDTADKRIAVVDGSGVLYDAIEEAAQLRNDPKSENGIFSGEGQERKQVLPRFVLERVNPGTKDIEAPAFELSQRVRERELFAFLLVDPEVTSISKSDQPDKTYVVYHSNNPAYSDAYRWLSGVINDRIRAMRFEKLNLDPTVVKQATEWVRVERRTLVTRDAAGTIKEAQKSNELAAIFVPMGMMMLMFAMIMVGAQPLMHSVMEEKMQRIAEVLLASISPFQLMMGKLIGTMGVSLTMLSVYLLGATYGIHRAGFGEMFPAHLIGWFVLYQVLAIMMFGSVFIAVGAAVTDLKEAQSMIMPVMLIVMIPLFVWVKVAKEPNAVFSVVVSLFPPATPMLMTLRQSTPAGVPLWQPLLGIALVLLTMLVCVFAASRIFRVGILMQGKGAKIGEMLRWTISG